MTNNNNPTSISSSFFQEPANPKLEEIKQQLESDSISQKLEAMKRLIAMISKGRSVNTLFPNVVKNVICPDVNVKKLVYMFLIHYAEFEQDLALLSINTFQKDLDNPNALIRAQALRVLSSIRLPVIIHILIISVKRCVVDNSPYVRKTAAHAIPKIYSLDHEQKGELVECIETLLGDNTTLVLGSAISAYSEVCPERIDLIHPHFRKMCNIIADIDEWGQISVINALARYARTQFGNPNPDEVKERPIRQGKKKTGFYSDSDSESESESEENNVDTFEIDSDHRLLLRATTPLLQSRNSGVVLAVAMLHYYCAPKAEAIKVGKSLVRVLRNPPQISYVILSNVATMSRTRPEMFQPFLSEFFVYDTDPMYIKLLKLEILTNIATENNISKIMREFTYYVKKEVKDFVTATIQAIGKCATRLPEVQDSCLHGLMSLLSNRSEFVVAESIVAIKGLLQIGGGEDTKIVTHLAKLLTTITLPNARASIVWMVGEYSKKIPTVAPDVLRVLCQSFRKEDKLVKLQVVNLAAKLLLFNYNVEVIQLMFQYICNLAKFDLSYDVRDRARVFRSILLSNSCPNLKQNAEALFFAEKTAPTTLTIEEGISYVINSLSHILKHTAYGYQRMPDWPSVIPDPSVRNQVARIQRREFSLPGVNKPTEMKSSTKGFYGDEDSEESSEYSDYTDSYSESSSEDDYPKAASKKASSKPSGAASFFDSPKASPQRSQKAAPPAKQSKKPPVKQKKKDKYGFSESESEESSSSSEEQPVVKKQSTTTARQQSPFVPAAAPAAAPAKVDDFFGGFSTPAAAAPASSFFGTAPPAASPFNSQPKSSGNLLSSGLDLLSFDGPTGGPSNLMPTAASYTGSSSFSLDQPRSRHVLLKQVVGQGLKVDYQYSRRPSTRGQPFTAIQLFFTNSTSGPLHSINLRDGGAQVIPFDEINFLPPNSNIEVLIHVKFTSHSAPVKFKIAHVDKSFPVEIQPAPGELIVPSNINPSDFPTLQKKLGGMFEVSGTVKLSGQPANSILSVANVAVIKSDADNKVYQFAGKTTIDNQDILLSLVNDKLTINCENAIFANRLLGEIKKTLEN